jgi:phosphoesterase RecJ-like protein
MTKIIKELAPVILEKIRSANSILIHCHPSPDPDSVGSALATKFALEQLGKKVTVIKGDSDIPKSFDFPGVNDIVGKNFFEIDLNDFDLFIIQDSGSKEMISAKGEVVFPKHMTTIVIDHHASNKGYGDVNCIDPSYPATGQLLHDLFIEMGIRLNHDIALNLLTGIITDTGSFRYGNNMTETLGVAHELSKFAPDFPKVISTMENSNRRESLIFEGIMLSSCKSYFDGKLAVASISNSQILENGFTNDDMFTGGITNKLKSVVGTQISATLVEREIGEVKVSLRSRDADKFDVSLLALKLGGGGHRAAAGVKLKMDLPSATEKLVKVVKEIYNIS